MEKTKPNLWGVIRPEDISQKGNGNYRADYMNWALTSHLMHEHAPGWDFELVEWNDQSGQPQSVYKAPDGSAYVVGRWCLIGTDIQTQKFPQACMDHRNNPVPYERVSARVLTDTERRCRCTSAAAAFGLAGELWARVAVEDPHADDDKPTPPPKSGNKVSPEVKDKMMGFFATHGVTEAHIEGFLGNDLKDMTVEQYNRMQEVGSAIIKGMDAFEALGISVEGEVIDDDEEPAFKLG